MDTAEESSVKSLIGKDKDGRPYRRHREVEEEIKAVLEWPLPQAFGLAAEGKLRPQTLVYLLRNFKPNRPGSEYDSLIVAFLSRLQRSGEPLVRGMSELHRERVHEFVKDKALRLMQLDRLDIFEMSFKTGAERLYLTAIAAVRLRARTEISREDLVEADSEATGEETADALGFVADSSMPLAQARVELKEVLDRLTEKERQAVFYVLQLDLTEKEAGEKMGCSDRNIRYLLKSAREKALAIPNLRARRARERA
ncbi:RNA polymerase sigma factor (sigma-70 family) [Bradyrhizobium japonicum]